jgi:hypothetical protein
MFMRYNGGAGGRWAKYNSNVDDDGSLFAVLAMHWESYDEYMHDPIDLTGSFDKGSVLSPLDYDGENHYHFSSIYTDLFSAVAADGSWSGGGATTADATEKPFFVESLANRICYQGLQYNRGQSGEFTEPVTNTGHLVSLSIATYALVVHSLIFVTYRVILNPWTRASPGLATWHSRRPSLTIAGATGCRFLTHNLNFLLNRMFEFLCGFIS